jgi:outer membrane protein OmpA-like peptidoglycan-associated protein
MKYFLLSLLSALSVALIAQTTIVDENFVTDNKKWVIEKGDKVYYLLKKGNYSIKPHADGSYWTKTVYEELDVDADFSIETSLKVNGKADASYGLIWNIGENHETNIIIQGNQIKIERNYPSTKVNTSVVDWKEAGISKGKYVSIKIEKKANILSYYINGKVFYKYGNNGVKNFYANKIGFFVNKKSELSVDYLKMYNYPATQVKTIENYDASIKLEKLDTNINSSNEESLPRISPDGNYLYCIRRSNENIGGISAYDDIWVSEKKGDGRWSKLKNIGKPLNNTGHNFVISASPDNNSLLLANTYHADGSANTKGLSISYKSNEKYQIPINQEIKDFVNKSNSVSYFLCNDNKTLLLAIETGAGMGDKDLYVSFLQKENSWSKPQSLGSVVNTDCDEHSPYLSADGKTLFFSSTGHYGYGDFDVFVSERIGDGWDKWTEPRNLGPNINSEGVETGYFMAAKGDFAYLSSNGDICKVKNPAYVEPVIILSGKVFDKKTGLPIGAAITYSNLSDDKTLGTASSDNVTGDYKIVLQKGKAYGFMANKNDYYSISENIDLTNLKEYKEIKQDLYLSPIVRGEPIRLNNIFFEFGKSVLKAESFPELDRLVNILNKNPEIKIEINGHTDDVGTDASNQVLSQDRAQSVVTYLQSKGISAGRLSAKGYGESKPDVPNNSDENRAFNRRVEFKIL